MTVSEIILHRLKLPLITPYRLSYRDYLDFDPILVEAIDADGRTGWGEGHISPGHTFETIEGGWAFCRERAGSLIGRDVAEAKAEMEAAHATSPVAASALVTALEMLAGHPVLELDSPAHLPLLTPFNATEPAEIEREVEARLAEGFRTLKIKVGKDAEADLARVAAIQKAVRGRATLRLDANRGFNQADGCRFASALDPDGIELFEQPCDTHAWDDNAAVSAVSAVPVMLDESIYGIADIERAAKIEGIGFIKLKLKKMGGIDLLRDGLMRIHELGMTPVLGDGVSSELGCWMEACVARGLIDNAGEFNGFLKPKVRLFANPLRFEGGALHLDAGFVPEIDRDVLTAHRVDCARITGRIASAT